ncbi:MAG: hypothetical protein Q4E58_06125 [Prevotellaceae bacterium]|nr:hypothetical protein [Prevotellaceae bacterium]
MKPVTETIDFTGLPAPDGINQQPNANVVWNGNAISSISSNGQTLRTFSEHPISVGNSSYWHLWKGSNSITYLQKGDANNDNFNIANLKKGDIVTVWGDNGNDDNNGGFRVMSDNNDRYDPNTTIRLEWDLGNAGQVITMNSDGTLQLLFTGQYSGVERITIQTVERETPHFDYDPGYEEYDLYDDFSENDPKKYNNNGQPYHTSYTLSTEETGFTLNGNSAQYIILSGSKNTANNRIAIDPQAGDWRFNYGLRSPSNTWGNFSISNLREGDRVVFSYTGTAPKFSSAGENGSYLGSKAFFDKYNDGTFDEDEDVYITPGATPEIDWYRGEGNIYGEDHDGTYNDSPDVNPLRYTRYVITEDGHLDIAIAPDTRIVKIKIFSDHQASMVDEYDADKYTAKFDITGELQAMEHIVPGGLEVHVGKDDASQHAHVVTSPHGPVSIVNGVNGYKLPGMSLNANGNLQFEFNLANNVPETGTFYKFIPLEDGKMKLTFQAASMNYYSYAIDGDEVYYGDNGSYGDDNWSELFDRPNEQTVDVVCPYYLVKVDENGHKTVTKINNRDYLNGAEVTYEIPGDVKVGETYYLYGGWNATGLSFSGSGQGQNNLEYLPYGDGNGGAQKACGVAKLLEVVFNPKKKIYPLAKWVPNGTTAVKDDKDGKIGVPNPDTFETEYELADLYGYNELTSLTIKKMSGNITACHPFIKKVQGNHYKLMIDGIQYGDGDKGGTILIKIGDARIKGNPVYALTIAYSADPTFDGNSGTGTRGHIWDYSSNALNGLKYDQSNVHVESHIRPGNIPVYTHNAATPEPYGHYFADYFGADISNYSSNDEVLEALPKSGTGLLYDEISGDASDWMFNYNLVNAGKLYDPLFTNKYDLEGDNADLIWNTEGMVLRTSANASVMFNEFKGTDIHQSTVDPDRYVGILKGGEFRIPWLMPNDRVIIYMGTGKGAFNDQAVFNIRGAYDAVYKEISESDDYIVGGSHWDGANGDNNYRGCYHFFAKGHDGGPADMVFKMTSGSMCKIYSIQIYRGDRIYTNEIEGDAFYQVTTENDNASKTNTWTLKHLGKDEQLANYSGRYYQMNDISASTGKFASYPVLTNNTSEDGKVVSFSYTGTKGDIGTIRVRAKDMEKNLNFVADYAEHNVTIAYQEAQSYPYTWDFTDVNGYSGDDVANEWTVNNNKVQSSIPVDTHYNLALWDENGSMRVNSQAIDTKGQDNIFESNSEQSANQLWAKHGNGNEATGIVIPETQGLWFYMDNNDPENNGKMQITSEGLTLEAGENDWCNKMVVPDVPAGGAVYLRMKSTSTTPVKKYKFGTDSFADINATNCSYYEANDNSGDYIVAIKNTGSKANLTLALGGWVLKKIAVSTDPKSVNVKGYASESRDHAIDHALTSYLTGKNIKAYAVSNPDYVNRTLTLTNVGSAENHVLPANQGCIINAGESNLNVLDGGFHLFVPDMHDGEKAFSGDNLMVANVETEGLLLGMFDGEDDKLTNYAMTYKYQILKEDGTPFGDVIEGDEMFYRVSNKGIKLHKNSAYLQLPTSEVKPSPSRPAGCPMFSFIFTEFDEGETVITGIEEAGVLIEDEEANAVWYNLNGQKLNGKPSARGIYIRNGKKVFVK